MILVRDNSELNVELIKSNTISYHARFITIIFLSTISLPFHNLKQPSIQNHSQK